MRGVVVIESSETPIQDFLRVLRSQRWLVLVSVVVAVTAALSFSLSQPNRYRATASLAFDNLSQDFAVVGSAGGAPEAPSALALRKAQTLLNADTLEAALKNLGNQPSAAQLRRQVTVAHDVTSNLVAVSAETGDADQATAIANAVAGAAVERETARTRASFASGARDLRSRFNALPLSDRRDASTRATYKERISRLDALSSVATPVRLDEPAQRPDAPFAPRPARSALVAGVVGLLFGLGLAFGRNGMDRRLHGADSIRAAVDLPIVGEVREEAMGKAGVTQGTAAPLAATDLEGFRILRANIEFLGSDDTKTILITSALPQEGKSTVAASLAWASAMSGRRTLLLECDLRRPTLAARLGVNATPGLAELLADGAGVGEVKRLISYPSLSSNGSTPEAGEAAGFDCVLAGRSVTNPAAMLGSAAFSRFLESSRLAYDVVIIDSAPLLPVVDTLEVFPSVDAAILCVRDGRTTRDQAQAARKLLANLSDKPVALVVTGLRREASRRYAYYDSHSYG
ncbi:MAG: hypothetical protein WKF96_08380 [Solirubrobacteraceae bacterium]